MTELKATQVAHELDELIMDDESNSEDSPSEGNEHWRHWHKMLKLHFLQFANIQIKFELCYLCGAIPHNAIFDLCLVQLGTINE